jgi:valyl-tRNA synthetase
VAASLVESSAAVAALARAEVRVDPEAARPAHSLLAIADGCEVYVPIEGVLDIDAERGRLSRELRRIEEELSRTESKLARDDFRQRAPAEVVAREEARGVEQRALRAKLREGLERLDALSAR